MENIHPARFFNKKLTDIKMANYNPKNVTSFLHSGHAHEDPKLLKLMYQTKLGWEAYGLFFLILELMRIADDICIENDLIGIYESQFSPNFSKIIDKCIELELFEEKIINDKKCIVSPGLQERINHYNDISEKRREAGKKRWIKTKKDREETDKKSLRKAIGNEEIYNSCVSIIDDINRIIKTFPGNENANGYRYNFQNCENIITILEEGHYCLSDLKKVLSIKSQDDFFVKHGNFTPSIIFNPKKIDDYVNQKSNGNGGILNKRFWDISDDEYKE